MVLFVLYSYLLESLGDGLHNAIKMSCEQLQAARIEQESTLAAGLRASGTAYLGMGELLVPSKGGDVLRVEAQTVVRYGARRASLLRRAVMRRRHGAAAMRGHS